MTKITLPTLTAADRQSFITALNGYLIPDYFDSVQYENGTDGTTFESIDEGAARVAVYLKDGVRAMAIDMNYAYSSGSTPVPKICIAGAAGITTTLSGGTTINGGSYFNSAIIDANHLWLGCLDAEMEKITGSGVYWPQLLLEKGANGTINATRVKIDTSLTTSYYVEFYTIAVGRSTTNTMQEVPVGIAKYAYNQVRRKVINTYTELARLFTEDAEDSVLLDTYLILTASSNDMLATGTLTLNGVTYSVIGLLAYTD